MPLSLLLCWRISLVNLPLLRTISPRVSDSFLRWNLHPAPERIVLRVTLLTFLISYVINVIPWVRRTSPSSVLSLNPHMREEIRTHRPTSNSSQWVCAEFLSQTIGAGC